MDTNRGTLLHLLKQSRPNCLIHSGTLFLHLGYIYMCVCRGVCVGVGGCVSVRGCVCMWVCEREWVCMYVCVIERERGSVCV